MRTPEAQQLFTIFYGREPKLKDHVDGTENIMFSNVVELLNDIRQILNDIRQKCETHISPRYPAGVNNLAFAILKVLNRYR